MPIYEYVCNKCGHQQDELHKVDEKPRIACEDCGAKPMARLVSAAGFRLSGSGWYETDFKSDNQKNLVGKNEPAGEACAPTGCAAPDCAAKPETPKPAKKEKAAKAKPAKKAAA